jgi:regulator of protease activity HflC (stomatin/prohibitin superfamily)
MAAKMEKSSSHEGIMVEIIGGILVLLILVVMSGLKIVNEYDRLVVFRLGKCAGVREPGLQLVLPVLERAHVVDMRMATLPIPTIETTTMDNLSVKLSAVCMYQIVDPMRAVMKVDDASKATAELAQTTLRAVVSQHSLHLLLCDRARVNAALKGRLEKQTKEWGVRIASLEIKDIKITRDMKKLIAKGRRIETELARSGADSFGLDHQYQTALPFSIEVPKQQKN